MQRTHHLDAAEILLCWSERKKFSKTFPCRLNSGSDCIHTSTSVSNDIAKIAEVGHSLNVSTLKVILYWLFNWGRGKLLQATSADIVWVRLKSSLDARAGAMVYPVLALTTIDGVGANSLEADATWVFSRLARLPRFASKTNHYLCLAQVDTETLSF